MPRVVPSDVVKAADRMFPDMVKTPNAFPGVGPDQVPRLLVLAKLVDAVAPELLTLKPEQYASLVACVAYIRGLANAFQAGHRVISFNLQGYDQNPAAMIRGAMAACPDEAPAKGTTELLFITDVDLRDSIRLDISAAHRDYAQGEWKGATVLAGSAIESLLLWRLQEYENQKPGALAAATAALLGGRLMRKPDANPETWDLHVYIEVAAHLTIVKAETATQARQAKDFRNLIHPGRATRLGQKCDRGTALAALAAVEFIVRDLSL